MYCCDMEKDAAEQPSSEKLVHTRPRTRLIIKHEIVPNSSFYYCIFSNHQKSTKTIAFPKGPGSSIPSKVGLLKMLAHTMML